MDTAINPFCISVGDDVLDDLRSRLRRTRWPEAELVDDWSQGAPLKWIQDSCRYWQTGMIGGAAKPASTASRSSQPRSMGSAFTSCTSVRPIRKPCRCSLPMAGRVRWSSSTR